ncbi:MAG TPA: hypothetical protein DCR13_05425 [Gammaproteobacteria bacterium]|nr:hypothetical protein [Gammaproteobacteria bacterium]
MKKWFHYIVMSCIVLSVTACGQKGPLYLPEAESNSFNQQQV